MTTEAGSIVIFFLSSIEFFVTDIVIEISNITSKIDLMSRFYFHCEPTNHDWVNEIVI